MKRLIHGWINNTIRSSTQYRPNYAFLLQKQLHLALGEVGDELNRHGEDVGSDGVPPGDGDVHKVCPR